MFNSTHTLVGVSLARTGLDRWAPHTLWTAVIASNLPDIDIATELHSTTTYIAYHRGITHTMLGVAFLSVALAGAMHLISGRFGHHLAIALIAMTTHPLLDYANTYGVRPFAPWSDRWLYGDFLFVIDPYVDLMLLGGILLGRYLKKDRAVVLASFAVVLAYMGGCLHLRNIAQEKLAEYTATIPGFERSAVSPQPLAPFEWFGIVETKDKISMVPIDLSRGVTGKLADFEKPEMTPAIAAAEKTRTGSVFMEFARFPVAKVYSGPEATLVRLIDVRFYRTQDDHAFEAEIRLDRALNVVSEEMGFDLPVD